MTISPIEQVRRFNRLVTLRTGALTDSYVGRGRPLGQARVLFEIGDGIDMRDLREHFSFDSGYLSRLLKALEDQGTITITPDPADRRRRIVKLTALGRSEREAYDSLSADLARSMLDPLPAPQQDRLVAAMAQVERLLTAGAVTIAVEPADSDVSRRCLSSYIEELARRFEAGFDVTKGNSVDAAAMSPPSGCFLVARLDHRPLGCGGLRTLSPGVGEIKRMWIAPQARGLGLAWRLLEALEEKARGLGMTRVVLDTNRTLVEAQAMYRKSGYREIAPYNDNPYADFWFEKELPATPTQAG